LTADISDTRKWELSINILEILAQRKFISAESHAHSNAHKSQKKAALEPDNDK